MTSNYYPNYYYYSNYIVSRYGNTLALLDRYFGIQSPPDSPLDAEGYPALLYAADDPGFVPFWQEYFTKFSQILKTNVDEIRSVLIFECFAKRVMPFIPVMFITHEDIFKSKRIVCEAIAEVMHPFLENDRQANCDNTRKDSICL